MHKERSGWILISVLRQKVNVAVALRRGKRKKAALIFGFFGIFYSLLVNYLLTFLGIKVAQIGKMSSFSILFHLHHGHHYLLATQHKWTLEWPTKLEPSH